MTTLTSRFAKKLISADEFETMWEFGHGYELVEGKIVKKSMPNKEHSLIASILLKNYFMFDPQEKVGRVLQEISTKLNIKNTPAPDVAFWRAERKPKRGQTASERPDIAVEIWSPRDLASQKRREETRAKIQRYLDAGVLLVWAIDPKKQIVEVYRAGAEEAEILRKGDILSREDVIPDFKVPVADLFEIE